MRVPLRWLLPAGLAAALACVPLLLPGLANAQPELPPTTAGDLLARLAGAPAQPLSGTVVQTTDLGLPELPRGQGAGAELSTLLAGSTTMRVWVDGPDRARVAVLGALAETDVLRDGRQVWMWRSDTNTARRGTLPERTGQEPPALPDSAQTPQEAAQRALAAIDPTTVASVDGTATVAGRDAYELVLQPRDRQSLVGQVRLAVDAETSLPLRVQVLAAGAAEPAFETGFTSISLARPDAGVFAFSPPPGATVEQLPPGGEPQASGRRGHGGQAPTVVGQGWTSVLVQRHVDPAALTSAGRQRGDGAELARTLADAFEPVQGSYGSGRLFTSSLVSALLLDDGRLLVGAVPPRVLEAAAASPLAAP
jgi:outer membrane lipoprotein-sorting protein